MQELFRTHVSHLVALICAGALALHSLRFIEYRCIQRYSTLTQQMITHSLTHSHKYTNTHLLHFLHTLKGLMPLVTTMKTPSGKD